MTEHALKDGIHDDVPMADYISDPCPAPSLSAGTVDLLISRSPAHARLAHPRFGGKSTNSRAADFGSAAHAWLSGDDKVETIDLVTKANGDVMVPMDYKTKSAQEARDTIRAHDKIPLLPHEVESVKAARDSAAKALEVFGGGVFEQTAIWQTNGVWCRARPDFLTDDYVVDLKTCPNAHPSIWQRTLFGSGHDARAAFYLRGLYQLTGRERDYVFLCQEKEEPYACSLVALGYKARQLGDAKVDKAIGTWRDCLAKDDWPGYDRSITYVDPPVWALWQASDCGIDLED